MHRKHHILNWFLPLDRRYRQLYEVLEYCPPKKVVSIPKKVVPIPKMVDYIPKIVAYPPNKK